ncbi:uroporphyrinogen-III C-methyltransferase [Opitutus sp. ER46]|uniref:uroporphyrinogen-III C-methyltransferase n=1 Tax=Opitutus sp. ER46 TaxID=2161864 RepID=UPI000D30ADF6|nr:uroporphyrinogen-III C-methyltransferase [Opitutus sp. ER46]PTX92490.1 uroporphyrinogen-III C-methyltransferase [Opitutus sp. ER46]
MFHAPTHLSSPTGTVHLVGAGPGDAELLTLKARRLISEADAIVYDYLVSPEVLAFARPEAERVFVGKKGGGFCCPQREIEDILLRLAREGNHVVRLKGGDPFVFGRGGEEAEALAEAGISFEVVPGITSALGAAAYAGVPLTHRAHASAVVFLTGHEDPAKPDTSIHWEDYGRLRATLCIYMGMKNLETITRRLQAGGLPASTPALVVQSATTGEHRQLLSTVANVALDSEHEGMGAPAMVVIGEVAALADKLAWFGPARQSLEAGIALAS